MTRSNTVPHTFFRRSFLVLDPDTSRPLDDRITMRVNGAGAIYLWAVWSEAKGIDPEDLAGMLNENKDLRKVAPIGGWRAEDVVGVRQLRDLPTNLTIPNWPWVPQPRRQCRDCDYVFVLDRANAVRCTACRRNK